MKKKTETEALPSKIILREGEERLLASLSDPEKQEVLRSFLDNMQTASISSCSPEGRMES